MKKPFDPFDEDHRDKVKRRRPAEVAYAKKCWEDRIDNHFKRALKNFGDPDYITSLAVYMECLYNPESNLEPLTLRRNTKVSLERIGYEKMKNPGSKDGKWKVEGIHTHVYRKLGKAIIDLEKLKKEMEKVKHCG